MTLLHEQIDHSFASLVWRLWNTLGVAGDSSEHQDCFIDLEALIILTSVIGKSDPRLLQEALDWCSKFHHFVSVSRLKTLIKELGPQVHNPYSTFAATLNSISKANWPIFSKTPPLSITPTGKSQAPNCKTPSLLGLRLRAFFGVGARADLIAFFLMKQSIPFTAADAVEVGYNKRTLAEILDSFVLSGLLSFSMNRNQKQYQIAKKDQLTSLAGELPHINPNWLSILTIVITLRNTLAEHQNHSNSSKVVAIRNALKHLKSYLDKLNIFLPLSHSDLTEWDSLVSWIENTIKSLIARFDYKETSQNASNFEQTFFSFMQNLYKVDDCIDGLEFIISCSYGNTTKHQEVFKECYQMHICYLEELKSRLEDLLKFPIYLLMDMKLSETIYKCSQEELPSLLLLIQKTPAVTEISLAGLALSWYKNLEIELNKLHRFMCAIENRLKELYLHKTSIHLITSSPILYKRHSVLKLFSANRE